jgi:hypothetical protein
MRPVEPFSRLKLTRRQFLEFLLTMSAWLPAPVLLAAASGMSDELPQSFDAFLDVLIPEDESPSASQLGVAAAILADAQAEPGSGLGRLIETGITWLDMQARRQGIDAFYQLNEAQQIAIVSMAEQQRERSLARVFFLAVRYKTFHHYYANPRSWISLGYSGPPQPRGFANHDKPLARAEP